MKTAKKKKKSTAGSQPEQKYVPATKKNLYLDRPMQIGGWPEGEYDPPVQDRISKYFKDMGLMEASVVAFHGTNADFDKFELRRAKEFGFHFALQRSQSEHIVSGSPAGRVFESRITYNNQIEMPDLLRWSFDTIVPRLVSRSRAEEIRKNAISAAKISGASLREELNVATAKVLDELGYDVIFYENMGEGGGQALIVWNPEQIHTLKTETLRSFVKQVLSNI